MFSELAKNIFKRSVIASRTRRSNPEKYNYWITSFLAMTKTWLALVFFLPLVAFATAQNPVNFSLSPTTGLPNNTSIGSTYNVTYTLTNTLAAPEPLKKVLVATTGTGFKITDNCSNTTLAVNGTCTLNVKFVPETAGNASVQLTLQYDSNIVPLPMLSTTVAGIPSSGQIIGTVTAPLPDKTSSGTTYQVQFTFVNNGATSVTATAVPTTGDLTNVTNNCTSALIPGAACTVNGTLVLNSAATVKVGATYEYGTGDDAVSVPLTTTTTVTSNPSCVQVTGLPTLLLPTQTYIYADNVVQFQYTNNCTTGSATLGDMSVTATLGGSDATNQLTVGDDTCSGQTLAAQASCVVSAAIVPTSTTTSNLVITSSLPYTQASNSATATTSTTATSVLPNDSQNRMLTVVNQCPYPVWMTFQAGNATAVGQATTNCKTDADCPANTSCNSNAAAGAGLCYWSDPTIDAAHPNGRLLAALANGAPDSIDLTIPQTNGQASDGRAAVAGGALYSGGMLARRDCTGTGTTTACRVNNCTAGKDGLCQPGQSIGSPPVAFNAAEFTFLYSGSTEGVYDTQIIDGLAVPIEMKGRGAATSGTAPYYNCQATGAPIQPAGAPATALGSCNYQLTPPEGADVTNYRYVTPASPQVLCNVDSDCSGGNICGLGYEGAPINKINKVCGQFEGYTSVNKGICSQSQSLFGTDKAGNNLATTLYETTFQCAKSYSGGYSAAQLYSCQHPPLGSCYGGAAPCCGCADWWTDPINIPVPTTTESCKNPNSDWTTLVQPTVQWMKKACPTSYVYQYDDPSSSYRCTVQNGEQIVTNYQITFCPGGKVPTVG